MEVSTVNSVRVIKYYRVLLVVLIVMTGVVQSLKLPFSILPVRRLVSRSSSSLRTVDDDSGAQSNPWSERDEAWQQNANAVEYVVGTGNAPTKPQFGLLAESIGLNISSELSTRNVIPHHLTTASDLFCNRELNMRQIEAIGFDMDWTLAQYNEAFDLLAYNGAKEKLVNWLGYPRDVLDLVYRQDLHRRGCLIDKKRGNIVKLDRHRYVRYAHHGLTRMSREMRKSTYVQSYQTILDMTGPNFVPTDTPFSLVDSCLFAQLVDLKDRLTAADSTCFLAGKSYEDLWRDMRRCVDRCHKDGVIKDTVAIDPSKYITYDPNIFPMFEGFRRAGRKVFLLTNSLWEYTNVVMNYLEGRKKGDQKDLEWTKYLDIIIVGGNKPAFLEDERSLALFRVDPKTGGLTNIDTMPSDGPGVEKFLGEGKIFQGGNAQILHKLLQLSAGDKLLYVGDHMYADILRSKRTLGWRTCLIIPELTSEIMTYKRRRADRSELLALRREQFVLESRLEKVKSASSPELAGVHAAKGSSLLPVGATGTATATATATTTATATVAELDEIKILEERIAFLKASIREKLETYNSAFHPEWGPLFKAGFQESRFALQINDYACMYTSRASNLGLVSPQRPFRPVRDKMPHDHYLEGL